jgi:hypothetical protein
MAVSGLISAGIYSASRSLTITLVSFAAGFLIDLDHVIDYWRAYPLCCDIRHFFRTCQEYRLDSLTLFLHSWELLVLLCLFAYLTRSAIALGLALGFTQHLLFDQFGNFVFPASYFFIYRYRHHFRGEAIFEIPPAFRDGGEAHGND